jgi:outer membrane protein
MKQLSLIFNIVLLVLVGYLYYLHFSNNKKPVKNVQESTVTQVNTGSARVAYLDLDSLQNNYGYYKKIKTEFEKKQEASNNEITNLQKRYQSRAMQLQQKGPTMNQQEQDAAMKEINQMQETLAEKKQSLDNELFNYNSKMKDDILKKIQDFLKDYNKDKRFDYIFSYEPGFMFYKDSTLDITRDVVTGLNDAYSKAKQ